MDTIFNCILILTFVTLSVSLDISLEDDPCSKFDSCHSKSVLKTCNCDKNCQVYGTCCYDVKKRLQDGSDHTFQCYSRRTAIPVFVKRSCSRDFRGHTGVKLACLEDDEDEMDVRNNLLVASSKTKTSYWNKHCAACSHEVESDLQFWNIVVSCPARKEVDKILIRRNLTFDQDKLQWGLMIDDEFLRCVVKYTPPFYGHEVRHCTPNIISNCSADYRDEDISTKCSQYYAERKLKNSETYFRNVHCAICNGADVKELECPGMSSLEHNVEESDFREIVEEIFTDGEWLEKKPGERFKCSEGYTYDPAREKCRQEPKKKLIIIPNSAHDNRIDTSVLLVVFLTLLFLAW